MKTTSQSKTVKTRKLPNLKPLPWTALALFVNQAEAKLEELGDQVGAAFDKGHVQAHLALMALEDAGHKGREKLEREGNLLRELEAQAAGAKDEVLLQAHLARADVLDAARLLRESLQRIERRLATLQLQAESEAQRARDRFGERIAALAARIGSNKQAPAS